MDCCVSDVSAITSLNRYTPPLHPSFPSLAHLHAQFTLLPISAKAPASPIQLYSPPVSQRPSLRSSLNQHSLAEGQSPHSPRSPQTPHSPHSPPSSPLPRVCLSPRSSDELPTQAPPPQTRHTTQSPFPPTSAHSKSTCSPQSVQPFRSPLSPTSLPLSTPQSPQPRSASNPPDSNHTLTSTPLSRQRGALPPLSGTPPTFSGPSPPHSGAPPPLSGNKPPHSSHTNLPPVVLPQAAPSPLRSPQLNVYQSPLAHSPHSPH
eukprot:GHVN01010149.1.p2 GENE.GHVN01010149.1~~GHVN01010149.1.p2  ORF type:complete len:261 (-),score=113.82 GHVN01010149.1:179-961(-)